MNAQPKLGVSRAVDRAFATLVRIWPADSREWALAMQAELPEIHNSQESLQWLAGGIMSLGKAWWTELFRGGNAEGKNLTPVKRPGALAGVTLLAALALLILPSAHQGLKAVTGSWRSNQSYYAYHDELMSMARDAESHGDAKMMAFIAMRLGPPSDMIPLANKAVAMDPSLIWILSQAHYEDYNNPGTRDWPAKLEAWDPGNAMGYMVEAEVRQGEFNPGFKKPYDAIESDPQWMEAGRKAVEAPRYDNYRDRRLAFDREVILAHGITDPNFVAASRFTRWPNSDPASFYSKRLLSEARLALARGDKETAKRDAWTVVHFGELVRGHGATDMERYWSFQYLKPAFEILQPILVSEGHKDEAAMLSQETEAMTLRYFAGGGFSSWSPSSQGWIVTSSVGMNLGAAFSIVLFAVLLLAGLWLLAARFADDLASGKLFRMACWTARFAPAGLLVSIVLLAASYWPSLAAIRSYLDYPVNSSTVRSLTESAGAVYWLPENFRHSQTNSANHQLIWLFVVVAGLFTVAMIVGRNMINRAPRVKAA